MRLPDFLISRSRRSRALSWRIPRYLSILTLAGILISGLWALSRDLMPLLTFSVPESEQFTPSVVAAYEDTGGSFASYVTEVRAHLQKTRLAVPHSAYSAQVQLEWVAPYTQKVARKCRIVRARALLIHGLYGSAYQMSDIASSLSRACIESDVMLLPGHGSRVSDLNDLSAASYYSAVLTRLSVFRRTCRDCLVVGYSMGALLASLALMDESRNIHGAVFIAPAWTTHLDAVSPMLNFANEYYDYSPFSRQKMLPTHYSYESIYAARQMFELTRWLHKKVSEGLYKINVPAHVMVADSDQIIPVAQTAQISQLIFTHPPSMLVLSDQGDYWQTYLAKHGASVEILPASWPSIGVQSLSHFSLVYDAFNLLYGFTGVYGTCMEPSGFDCSDVPIEVIYGARQLRPGKNEAATSSNPEFDPMMSSAVRFIRETAVRE
ncbi:MAG: alpha/beta hydrolase [Gammaproteobacteria bacterium]|nr:alpha/beta hydrolase [Gammaproteobacteria bacterium]